MSTPVGSVQWLRVSEWLFRPHEVGADVPVVAVMPWLNEAAARQAARLMVSRAGVPLLVLAVQDDLSIGPMAVWNRVIGHVRSPYFIYCAEDAFAGRYWLRLALQAMEKPGAGLLAFNDGKWFGQLAAFGMVRRNWLAPIYGGSLFHEGYSRHYGDTELTLIARQQQALVYHPHALLLEVDYDKDRRPVDVDDHALFRQRAAAGFDGRVNDENILKCVA
jgi:hypothetical protein